MDIKIEPHKEKKGVFTVTPFGAIDSDTHQSFRDQLQPVLTQNPKIILVDLQNVDTITSAGLGVLFSIKKQLIAGHGELLFCNLKPQIAKLFEIVKTLPRETVFHSIEEADAYFLKVMEDERRKHESKPKN